MMDCDQIRALLEGYALGALDADEQASVELHLAGCAECRRMANEYSDVANMLPRALAVASPLRLPSSVKSRLLRSLEDAADTAPAVAEREPPAAPEAVRASPVKPAAATPAEERRQPVPRTPSWRRPRVISALAAAIVLALALAWSVQLSAALARERALRAEFAQLIGRQEVVFEVIDSSKAVKAVLRPQAAGSPAYGKLFTRPDLPDVVVMAAKLPEPPAGQAYHVWLGRDGRTELAGVLAFNQGFGLLTFKADRDGPVYESAQIVLQPEGATAPAGVPVLRWEAPK